MALIDFTLIPRRLVAFSHDIFALVVCWYAALWLRFNLELPYEQLRGAYLILMLLLVVHAPIYWFMGLYRGIWRFASVMDLRRIIVAVSFAAMGVTAAILMFRIPAVPRSVLVLHPILLILVMGGSRFAYRAWKDHALYGRIDLNGEPVLVIGAGNAAERLLRELDYSQDWKVVGLLEDGAGRAGREVRGRKILGSIDDVALWAEKLDVKRAIVAMPEASQAGRRRAMEAAVQAGLSVLTVPSLEDLLSGNVAVSQMRQVQLEDLLGREPLQLDDRRLLGWLGEKVVLVTGAGGSIGSELVRQIIRFKPRLLVLYELSEFALYQIEEELSTSLPSIPTVYVVGDVKDVHRLDQVFATYKPSLVFHAAYWWSRLRCAAAR